MVATHYSLIEELRGKVQGEVIGPDDKGYNDARSVYNAMIDRRPGLIVRCATANDVTIAINAAKANNLAISVRGGGHNAAGLGVVDDGLVIDLSLMKDIHVDPDAQTVRVGGGCVWGEVDQAAHAHGLAVPTGIISTTGVGGLTLGGGLGYLTRKYGYTIDNLLGAKMVLADGVHVNVNADENADLFWAIRGGGGNFGVVTEFLFRARPVKMVYAGPTLWPLEQSAEVMRFFDNFIKDAPRELSGFFAFLTVPPGPPFPEHLHLQKMCGVVWCYNGPLDKADEIFAPVREFGPPALDGLHEAPFPGLQSAFDELYPPGLQWYWKADFVNELTDEAIAEHVKHGAQMPTMHSSMHLYPVDGAAHDVGRSDTAFSFRDARYSMVIVGVDPDPANADTLKSWARAYWEAVHPYSAGGAYVNFMMEEEDDRVEATYRDNYARLAQIKGKYDPGNVFKVNWNIKPAK